jgi:Tol biopolymer transport system component
MPQGATVRVDGKALSVVTPTPPFELDWKKDSVYTIEVSLDGYESQSVGLTYDQARAMRVKPWRLPVFQLAPVRSVVPVQITSSVRGAEVQINSRPVGVVPLSTNLVFTRAGSSSPWSTNTVSASKLPNYAPVQQVLTFKESQAAVKTGGLKVELQPGEVRRAFTLDIQSNEPGAEVAVNTEVVGNTPLRHEFVFVRSAASDAWPEMTVRIQKDGYEHLPAGETIPQPAFSCTVTADRRDRAIEAMDFVVPKFVMSPIRFFDVQPGQVRLGTSNIWSQVTGGERDEKATSMTQLRPGRPLVVSGIASLPGREQGFVYVEPTWEDRPTAGSTPASTRLIGSQLVKQLATGATTPMTDSGRFFDLDPCVSQNWIYFSSDRNGDRIIWRVPLSGKGGYTPITGTHTKFDTEPALNRDETRLAFVSRMPNAPVTMPTDIWIADSDGKLPTRYYPGGRNPAWSPDGKRLAYVNMANNLCVVVVDSGQNPTQLTSGPDHQVQSPVWLDDHRIIYADNPNKNGRGDTHFDLWMWDLDRNSTQALTSDGSFDSSPSVDPGGRQVYFYSNRGATRTGEEQLKIYGLALDMRAPGR